MASGVSTTTLWSVNPISFTVVAEYSDDVFGKFAIY